jgi:hypothetical protein
MTTKIRIELDHAGIQELLMCDGVSGVCRQEAERIAAQAGDGYEVIQRTPKKRAYYFVAPVSQKAAESEATDKTLSKAVR